MQSKSYLNGFSGATVLFALILVAGWYLRWPMIHPDPMTPEAYLAVGACIAGVLVGTGAVIWELWIKFRARTGR